MESYRPVMPDTISMGSSAISVGDVLLPDVFKFASEIALAMGTDMVCFELCLRTPPDS